MVLLLLVRFVFVRAVGLCLVGCFVRPLALHVIRLVLGAYELVFGKFLVRHLLHPLGLLVRRLLVVLGLIQLGWQLILLGRIALGVVFGFNFKFVLLRGLQFIVQFIHVVRLVDIVVGLVRVFQLVRVFRIEHLGQGCGELMRATKEGGAALRPFPRLGPRGRVENPPYFGSGTCPEVRR